MRLERDQAVRRLLRLLGAEGLLALTEAYGGRRVYVPMARRRTSRLREVLSECQVDAIAAHCGGEYLVVPLARAWRAAIYRARGESYAVIAGKLGCTESAVGKLLRAQPSSRPSAAGAPGQRCFPF